MRQTRWGNDRITRRPAVTPPAVMSTVLSATTCGVVVAWPSASLLGAAGAAAAAACAALAVRERIRLRGELSDLRRVIDTARTSLVQRLPPRCGPVRVAGRYLAAAPYGGVGGDLYDVVNTPFGVRVIIADVKGHGIDAFGPAADLLGAFRDLAQHEPTLAGTAQRLDARLAARTARNPEEFVTALLLQVCEPDAIDLVCCGHPAPLLLSRGRATPLDTFPGDLPLGLLSLSKAAPSTSSIAFGGGDHLLLYTDGITEARDAAGRFFPFVERAASLAGSAGSAEDLLGALTEELLAHGGGRLQDDVALLSLRHEQVPQQAHPRPAARAG